MDNFIKYGLIKFCLYIDDIKNEYDKLTENHKLKELWKAYQVELGEKSITIPGTVNNRFESKRFKIPANTLNGTGDKNGRGEDSNTNEIMNNILTSNAYLNDQKNCS